MNRRSAVTFVAAALFVFGASLSGELVSAQASSRSAPLPSSFQLSEVEIGLNRGGGGGCVGRCIRYRVTIRGDGVVEFEDLADPPAVAIQRRTVPIGDVVSLINEFLRARFFDALDRYEEERFIIREGDRLLLRGSGGIDGPTWDISLRLGPLTKTVRLYMFYPTDLGKVRDLIEQMGGPTVWSKK